MRKIKSDTFLMLSIIFAIITAIIFSYIFISPTVYEQMGENVGDNASNIEEFTTEATVNYPLNINTVTAEELMAIPSVGENRAYAIIDYREHLGGYTSVEQIKDIYGISESLYQNISQYLIV